MELTIACENGDIERVRELLKKYDMYKSYYGVDLMTTAIINRKPEIVKMLIEEYNYNWTSCVMGIYSEIHGFNHFFWCLRTNQLDLAMYLLEHNFEFCGHMRVKIVGNDDEHMSLIYEEPLTMEDLNEMIGFNEEKYNKIKGFIENRMRYLNGRRKSIEEKAREWINESRKQAVPIPRPDGVTDEILEELKI